MGNWCFHYDTNSAVYIGSEPADIIHIYDNILPSLIKRGYVYVLRSNLILTPGEFFELIVRKNFGVAVVMFAALALFLYSIVPRLPGGWHIELYALSFITLFICTVAIMYLIPGILAQKMFGWTD